MRGGNRDLYNIYIIYIYYKKFNNVDLTQQKLFG